MIGAPNTRSQKYLVGVIQVTPGTPISEIADIFRNYNIDSHLRMADPAAA